MAAPLYNLLQKIVQKLKLKHRELNYYMSLCSTVYTPTFTTTKGSYNSVTTSDCSAALIGNYLCVDFRATMTSSQQTSVGTGDITNRSMGTMVFSDFYYNSGYTDLTNEERKPVIYQLPPYNIGAPTAYSTGNGHVGQWYISYETSGHTLTITFNLAALQAKTSQVRCIYWIPVHRCPWSADAEEA